MIAMYPTERAGETRRIETPHFHAGLAERAPESPRRLAESAHPIVDHAHAQPVARFGLERLGKFSADLASLQQVIHAPPPVPSIPVAFEQQAVPSSSP